MNNNLKRCESEMWQYKIIEICDAGLQRYVAARWLRRTIGGIGGKEFPAEPSEEEFRMGLRSGIILCNVLNKIQPGIVPKV